MAIVSVVEMFQLGYGAVMVFDSGYFSTYAMFGLSAGIDVALASVLYVVQRRGASFREKLWYWMTESLMSCGVLSIFAAVMLGVAALNLVWLVATFVLGNLYTLSVLSSLSIGTPAPSLPMRRGQSERPSARSGPEVSTPTLTNDVEGRHGVDIEVQTRVMDTLAPATTVPVKDPDGKIQYVLGYHSGDGVV
ncbi:hypothetical protein C8T65DRAFT_284516 [Cerioporus squamosus]|nr:hypothetical protein C8T65DRAFT_284516 [Cerioporus squamosus]